MKNVKVTYKYLNYSRLIYNLLAPYPEDPNIIGMYEAKHMAEDTAICFVEGLKTLDFIVSVEVTDEIKGDIV